MSKFVLSVIGLSLVAILAIYFVGSKGSEENTVSTNSLIGTYELSSEKMNLGEMTVDDKKTANFTFRNTSSEKMNLSRFETSCNCTMTEVKINGETSPMFNMPAHMSSAERAWNHDLAPGETAEIGVTYEPALMPVYGPIERYSTFKINNSKEIRLTVSANVK
ncbi:MAG: DUF1573 domain-containing protein [Candidatus Berkelbacteria bacterium]|nr:DUF1573 domain-containing protein [Candidatus Berkelbacteria bacterium]MCR4307953.1 DUF1573 domain-containing protein [Candidatus Berkelbacteria bacterium]